MQASDNLEELPSRAPLNRWRLGVIVLTLFAAAIGFAAPQWWSPAADSGSSVIATSTAIKPMSPTAASRTAAVVIRGLPVYYVGSTNQLMYREFRDLTMRGSREETAIAALLELPPFDPDYVNYWSPASHISVKSADDILTVDLAREAFTKITTPAIAERALAQLVYTVTAAVGDPHSKLGVRVLVGGSATLPDVFGPPKVHRRDGLKPLAPLWVTSPAHQETAQEGTVTIQGVIKPDLGLPTVTITDSKSGGVVGVREADDAGDSGGWRLWRLDIGLTSGSYLVTAKAGGNVLPDTKLVKVAAVGQ